MVPPTMIWLASLVSCPVPIGPMRVTRPEAQRLRAGVEGVSGAAHHDGERAVRAPGVAAGHRRIDIAHAECVRAAPPDSCVSTGIELMTTSDRARRPFAYRRPAEQHVGDVGGQQHHDRLSGRCCARRSRRRRTPRRCPTGSPGPGGCTQIARLAPVRCAAMCAPMLRDRGIPTSASQRAMGRCRHDAGAAERLMLGRRPSGNGGRLRIGQALFAGFFTAASCLNSGDFL